MNADVIANGGIVLSLKAHAVCGHCTEFSDLQEPVSHEADEFAAAALVHFERLGWRFTPGKKARCPSCARRRRPSARENVGCPKCSGAGRVEVRHVKGCELGTNWKDCPACVSNKRGE